MNFRLLAYQLASIVNLLTPFSHRAWCWYSLGARLAELLYWLLSLSKNYGLSPAWDSGFDKQETLFIFFFGIMEEFENFHQVCTMYDVDETGAGITEFQNLNLGSVSSPLCVCETRKRYVVKHNLITEVYLMTMWWKTTTCFGLYWPSSGCLGNLRASYMHARTHVV